MEDKTYRSIVRFCEDCLDQYGDNYRGVAWTKRQEDADTRYQVMLDVMKPNHAGKTTLLDLGCGASHLYEYIVRHKLENIEYSGLDVSEKFLALSRRKFPAITYYHLDILDKPDELPEFDFVVMNGLFTAKVDVPYDDMLAYFKDVVSRVFTKTRVGMAFNVMSKQVEWERDDLFYLPFDVLASFLTQQVSRHFVIRHDYGLFEYCTYVYREPHAC